MAAWLLHGAETASASFDQTGNTMKVYSGLYGGQDVGHRWSKEKKPETQFSTQAQGQASSFIAICSWALAPSFLKFRGAVEVGISHQRGTPFIPPHGKEASLKGTPQKWAPPIFVNPPRLSTCCWTWAIQGHTTTAIPDWVQHPLYP